MIKDFIPRLYQETIFATAANYNTLVVLPTGLGKTNVFIMLAAHRLKTHPDSKILLLGPTRPLIEQYHSVFLKHLDMPEDTMAIFTGLVHPEKRAELWKKSNIIFSTPQGLENDIMSGRVKLEEVSLLGFDEAHRAVQDYAYVWIAKQYMKTAKYPRILAMTASPGSDMEKIKEVCTNLSIEKVEVRTEQDKDVKPYMQEIELDWIYVTLPDRFIKIRELLLAILKEKGEELKKYGVANSALMNKTELLRLQAQIHGQIARGSKDFQNWKTVSVLAEIMKVQHALELLETQGSTALHRYLERMFEEATTTKTKAVKNLAADEKLKSARALAGMLYEENIEHPKMEELTKLAEEEIKKTGNAKIIVFNQYRDSASKLTEVLNKIEGVQARLFVGQMKKHETGLTQKEQKAILDSFRKGNINVLVATSIGEEGLDIPQVDLVIFYEPVPSAIRQIQRRGRTGRQEKGRAVMLVTKNTRDEAYKWVAHHKEKRMYRNLENIRKNIVLDKTEKKENLTQYFENDKVKVVADLREKGSGVPKELIELGAELELKTLDVGDYACSARCCIEMKTVKDFVDSIVDGRMLRQALELKKNYERPLVIIEGDADIYSVRNVHPKAIMGMLATISVSYGIPIIYTKTAKESAGMIMTIAKREQAETGKDISMHADRKPLTLKQQQEYIVSSFPGIGPALAKPLLKKFGSVKKLVNAKEEKLKKVDLIGEKKASDIRKVLDSEYDEK